MTTTVTERMTLQPIKCQPWCLYQDGHGDDFHRDDQTCYSEKLRVDLLRHDPVAESYFDESRGEYVPGPDFINVDVRQNGYETEPCITIWADHKAGPNLDLRLTPSEALELSHTLQLLLGRTEVKQ